MRNIRDWREATLMLSFEEKGYFDELVNLIYLYDDLLPDSDEFVCRAMPVHKKLHLRLKKKLLETRLIEIRDGFYFNKRATEEVVKINEISQTNRIKAQNRWAKSLKNNKCETAAAKAQQLPDASSADAEGMLNLKVKSESDLTIKNKQNIQNKRLKNAPKSNGKSKSKTNTKCAIDAVLDPDGEIPEPYLDYAREQGLNEPERTFLDWANWWLSENGRKAGPRGWLATWKARVRKDVDRQMAENRDKKGRNGSGRCATTEGARLALDRRRNRRRKI